MSWLYLRENREKVLEALRRKSVDEAHLCITTEFDKLAGLMREFGHFKHVHKIKINLKKDEDDVPNELLLNEMAIMPILRIENPAQIPHLLFRDHGVLRFIGFNVKQIREGFNTKGRKGKEERMLPHHRDDVYNALKAIEEESLEDFRRAHISSLFDKKLLPKRGIYTFDGSGIEGTNLMLVVMLCLTEGVSLIVNWRLTKTGCELSASKEMMDEMIEKFGEDRFYLLILDALYADGEWIGSLKNKGIDVMVRVDNNMEILGEMINLSSGYKEEYRFKEESYVGYFAGKKEERRYKIAMIKDLHNWDAYDKECKSPLTGLLIKEDNKNEDGKEKIWGIVTTKNLEGEKEGFSLWRKRWDVENRGFRELNQGVYLEKELWGRSFIARKASIYLKIGALNCYRIFQTERGKKLANKGIERFHREYLHRGVPMVLVIEKGEYGLFNIEEIFKITQVDIKEKIFMKKCGEG